MRPFFLALALGLCFAATAQRRSMLVLTVNLPQNQGQTLGGKLAYFHPLTHGVGGLKTGFNTNTLCREPLDARSFFAHIDLVRRWSLHHRSGTRLWCDAGVSVRQDWRVYPPGSYITAECGFGNGDYIAFNPERFVEKEFFSGLALATGLDIALNSRVAIGAEMTGNVYYGGKEKTFLPYLVPALSCSMYLTD